MADFVLKGCPYPLTETPHGYFYSQTGVDQIKSDLLSLLLTNPKSRVMHPEFGTPLRSLMFEPADGILTRKAKEIVINAISRWEPRIAVAGIKTSIDPDTNSLRIEISFRDPKNIKDIELLTLELPIGEGASS
jgi:phage baseplate assembly protein W